jgi:hypothetical protein
MSTRLPLSFVEKKILLTVLEGWRGQERKADLMKELT